MRGLIAAGGKQRERRHAAIEPATAKRHGSKGRQFGQGTGPQFLVIGAAHGSGRHAGQRVQCNHGKDAITQGGGARSQRGRPQFGQGQQADEIDRVIGGRVPFGQTILLDRIEPPRQPLRGEGSLRSAGSTRRGKDRIGETLPGQ